MGRTKDVDGPGLFTIIVCPSTEGPHIIGLVHFSAIPKESSTRFTHCGFKVGSWLPRANQVAVYFGAGAVQGGGGPLGGNPPAPTWGTTQFMH